MRNSIFPDNRSWSEPPRFEDGRQALLVFRIGETTLALDAHDVEAVHELSPVSPVPHAPAHLLGLVRLGEHAVPLVDTAKFLGLEALAPADTDDEAPLFRRIIVVRVGDMRVGLSCDRAAGVADVDAAELQEPTAIRGGRLSEFLEAEIHTPEAIVVGYLNLRALLDAARLA